MHCKKIWTTLGKIRWETCPTLFQQPFRGQMNGHGNVASHFPSSLARILQRLWYVLCYVYMLPVASFINSNHFGNTQQSTLPPLPPSACPKRSDSSSGSTRMLLCSILSLPPKLKATLCRRSYRLLLRIRANHERSNSPWEPPWANFCFREVWQKIYSDSWLVYRLEMM